MSDKIEKSNIVVKEKIQLKPSEITLNYLIDEGLVSSVIDHEYDLSLYDLDLSNLETITNQSKVLELFRNKKYYTLDKTLNSNIIDLSRVGLGLVPENNEITDDENYRYGYINEYVKSINSAIKREKTKETRFSKVWQEQTGIIQEKYKDAQCKNNLNVRKLKRFKLKLALLRKGLSNILIRKKKPKQLKRLSLKIKNNKNKLLKLNERKELKGLKKLFNSITLKTTKIKLCFEKKHLYNLIQNIRKPIDIKKLNLQVNKSFDCLQKELSFCNVKDFGVEKFGDNLFKSLGLKYSERPVKNTSDDYVKELGSEYLYFINFYHACLSETLILLKKEKIKKLDKVFSLNTIDSKNQILNRLQNIDYEEFCKYNFEELYCFYRSSLICKIQKYVDNDIKLRKVVDGIVQYSPSIVAFGFFIVALVSLFIFNYTLLKDLWKRNEIIKYFIIISVCAVVLGINFFRNSKQFKRPKRKKFSMYSLINYCLITCVIFGLDIYFINRYDGYDNTYYYVNAEDNCIKIDGLVDKDNEEYIIPSTIDGKNVTSLSKLVFKNNKNIKKLSSNQDFSIDKNCFKNCENLTTINFPAISGEIADNAFENCKNLKTVNINKATKIGEGSFKNCNELKEIDCEKVEVLLPYAFENCTNLGNIKLINAKALGEFLFKNCFNLEKIELNEVTTLDKGAFYNCYDLNDINFNSLMMETIPTECFYNCSSLSELQLPLNIKTIDKSAFYNCYSIQLLTLNSTINNIKDNAFGGCFGIKELTFNNNIDGFNLNSLFGDGIKNIQKVNLKNTDYIPEYFFENCSCLVSLSNNQTIKKIGKGAFKNCSSLSNFEFVESCNEIESSAFENCSSMRNIFLNNSVKTIKESTFSGCSLLQDIDLSKNITNIEKNAFLNCRGLTNLIIGSNVQKIDKTSFDGCYNIKNLELPITDTILKDFVGDYLSNNVTTLLLKANVNKKIPDAFMQNATSVNTITISGYIDEIGKEALKDCTSLRSFITDNQDYYIGEKAFYNTRIKEIINTNVSLGIGAFENCHSLSNVTLTANEIPDRAFTNCNNLISFNFEGIQKVGNNSFQNCYRLTELNLDTIKTIGSSAFSGCSELELVGDFSTINSIGNEAFKGIVNINSVEILGNIELGQNIFLNCYNIREIHVSQKINNKTSIQKYMSKEALNNIKKIIVEDVESITNEYFKGCENVSYIEINGTAKNIENKCFSGFNNLQNVKLTDSIETIGSKAFDGCILLSNITLPSSLKRIGKLAFNNCSNLENIKLSSEIEYVGYKAFSSEVNIDTSEVKEETIDNWNLIWHNNQELGNKNIFETVIMYAYANHILIVIVLSIILFFVIIFIVYKIRKRRK